MLTVRQIERWWQVQAHDRLIDELCVGRAEAVSGIRPMLAGPTAAAALAVIRLDELHQSHQPFDPVTTALALRALGRGAGTGRSIDKAVDRLAALQRDDGQWPREPFRRFPGDGAVTAFVLFQLAETRTAAATALIDTTIDRVAMDLTDRQLAPLRRRVQSARQLVAASN